MIQNNILIQTPLPQKIAIVGAGGHIGSALYDALNETGHHVVGYDQRLRKITRNNVTHLNFGEVLTADVQSFDAVMYLSELMGRRAWIMGRLCRGYCTG